MSGRKQFDVEQAVQDAMLVFWDHGYAGSSVGLLSKATGLGRGSLYGTFGSKEELFRRTLELYSDTYGHRYDAAMRQARGPEQVVRAFLATALDRLAEPRTPSGCLLAHSVSESPSLDETSRRRVHALLGRQVDRLDQALTATGLLDSTAGEIAHYVGAVNQGLAVMHRGGTAIPRLRAVAEATSRSVELLLAVSQRSAGE